MVDANEEALKSWQEMLKSLNDLKLALRDQREKMEEALEKIVGFGRVTGLLVGAAKTDPNTRTTAHNHSNPATQGITISARKHSESVRNIRYGA